MGNKQIMIVEDEGIIAMELEERLNSLGYNVCIVVASGEEALERIKNNSVDLVLMDIRLRGNIDGIETAKIIRKTYNIPVIYLTAFADEETMERAKMTEPYAYLFKPFEEKRLHTTIEGAFTWLYQDIARGVAQNERFLL